MSAQNSGQPPNQQQSSANTQTKILQTLDDLSEETVQYLMNEYNALRAEIVQRIGIQHQLILAVLVGAGTFLGAGLEYEGARYILLVYPLLATFVASAWSHNNVRIQQIGHYIEFRIEKRLPGGMGWEHSHARVMLMPKWFPEKWRTWIQTSSLALLAANGIIVGSQIAAMVVFLATTGLTWEDGWAIVVDVLLIVLTLLLLQRHEIKLQS